MTKKPPQRLPATLVSAPDARPDIDPDTLPVAAPDTALLMSEMRQRIEMLEAQIAELKLYLADFIAMHADPASPSKNTEDDGAGDAER